MLKILSQLALVLMFILMVPAGLIMVSQDAVKGDIIYPIKRGLESGVLVVASLTPYTKAYFAVALVNRRYKETAFLLSSGDNASDSLKELVAQTDKAVSDIGNISGTDQKRKLIADLSSSIKRYDQGLAQAQQEIATKNKSAVSQLTTKPVSKPSSQQPPPPPTGGPSPSPSTASYQPAYQQQPYQQGLLPPDQDWTKQQQAIEQARRELEELRKKLEQQKMDLQSSQTAPSPSPTPSPQIEPTINSAQSEVTSNVQPTSSATSQPSPTTFQNYIQEDYPLQKGRSKPVKGSEENSYLDGHN